MRKFLGVVFVFSFAGLATVFLILLNFKLGLWSPDKIKNLASQSNIYEFVSASVRESLVESSNASVGQGEMMEVITETINPETTQEIAESVIDQWFLITGNPQVDSFIEVPLSKYNDRAAQVLGEELFSEEIVAVIEHEFGQSFSLSRNILIDLENNQTVVWFSRINTILVGYAAVLLLGIALILLVPGSTAGGRLSWLGSAFLFSFVCLISICAGVYFTSQPLLDENIARLGISDPKALVGLKKFFSLVLNQQIKLLAIESGAMFILGLFFFTVGRSMKEHKLDLKNHI